MDGLENIINEFGIEYFIITFLFLLLKINNEADDYIEHIQIYLYVMIYQL